MARHWRLLIAKPINLSSPAEAQIDGFGYFVSVLIQARGLIPLLKLNNDRENSSLQLSKSMN